MIRINLLSFIEDAKPKVVRKGPQATVPRVIPVTFGFVIAILLALYLVAHLKHSLTSSALSAARRTLEELTESASRAKAVREGMPVLRKRAEAFQTRLQQRKVWSKLLGAIAQSCPEGIRLTQISLTVPRGSASRSPQSRELLIKGFYRASDASENSELIFASNLQRNSDLASHFPRILVAMTDPLPGKTEFSIRCAEQ